MLLQLTGEPSPARTPRRTSPGLSCDMRSTIKRLPSSATKSCCEHGWAKLPGLRSNDSQKSGVIAMVGSCQRLGLCGARLMRKPADRRAYREKCERSFQSDWGFKELIIER